ncbi:MAG: hypothetical protein AB7I08_17200 [Thermoleophilia bacterium]
MNVQSILGAVQRFWWLGLGVFAVCALGGAFLALGPSEKYEATATVLVLPSEDLGSNIQGIQYVLPSLPDLVDTTERREQVRTSLPEPLQGSDWDVFVETDPQALLMTITVESTDRQVVVPAVNRFSQFTIENPPANARLVDFSILEAATDVSSTSGSRVVILASALALGVIAGILAMFAANALLPRVLGAGDIRGLGLPVLAEIPMAKDLPRSPADVFDQRRFAPVAEAFERLRINLDGRRSRARRSSGAIAVCSLVDGEGKTTVTANLAWATAAVGQGVTAVDTDLRAPDLHSRLGVPNAGGLGTADPSGLTVVERVPLMPELGVVPAERVGGHRTEILAAELPHLLTDLTPTGELVLVDTPALDEAPEALVVVGACRAVILVIEANRLSPAQVEDAVHDLAEAGSEVLGVVMNRSRRMTFRGLKRPGGSRRRPSRARRGASAPADEVPGAERVPSGHEADRV